MVEKYMKIEGSILKEKSTLMLVLIEAEHERNRFGFSILFIDSVQSINRIHKHYSF